MGYRKSSYDEAKKILSFINSNPEINYEEVEKDYFKKGLDKIDKLVIEVSQLEKKLMEKLTEREDFFDDYIDNVVKYRMFIEKKFGKDSKEAKEINGIQPDKTAILNEYENFAEEEEELKNKSKNKNNNFNKNKKTEQKNTKQNENNKNNNNKKVVKDKKKN